MHRVGSFANRAGNRPPYGRAPGGGSRKTLRALAQTRVAGSRAISPSSPGGDRRSRQATGRGERDHWRPAHCAAESEQQILLRDVLASRPEGEIVVAIGPEGGWTEEELQFFQKAGWISASLGSTILRAETAAIAA